MQQLSQYLYWCNEYPRNNTQAQWQQYKAAAIWFNKIMQITRAVVRDYAWCVCSVCALRVKLKSLSLFQ